MVTASATALNSKRKANESFRVAFPRQAELPTSYLPTRNLHLLCNVKITGVATSEWRLDEIPPMKIFSILSE